ncbi:heavy-metal-associated domain-containing protein [Acinetobacter variabilis]|nr:heavy-metal-associated domain-containing protein [Acinetobacter variabilis]
MTCASCVARVEKALKKSIRYWMRRLIWQPKKLTSLQFVLSLFPNWLRRYKRPALIFKPTELNWLLKE